MGVFKEIQDMLQTYQQALANTWFIILPWLFYFLFRPLWMDYIQIKHLGSLEYALLEIIPPRDIEKSPKLMESFFAGFAGAHTNFNTAETYIKGMLMPRLSLEIVSDGGKVHLYIRTIKKFRNLVESNLYAQYPDAQIVEVDDYVNSVPRIIPNKDWDLWGSDLDTTKPDAYPIKTYHKFEEDVTGKMIDPLSALLEAFGKIGPNQKAWFQMIVFPEAEKISSMEGLALVQEYIGKKKKSKGALEKIWIDITDVFKNLFNALMGNEFKFTEEKKDQQEQPIEFKLTPGQKDVLKAIEENIGKNFFWTKMRFMYLGKRSGFDKANVSAFFGAIKQFNDQNLNGFKPNNDSKTTVSYLLAAPRMRFRQMKVFKRYLSRDPSGVRFKLSSSELATLFHLPDMSVMAPSINRVEAKRGGAPYNLPIEE